MSAELKAEGQKKSRSKSARSKQSSSNNASKLKVVIRRLPPNLPENIFWQSVSKWVTDESASWKLYVPGKLRTKLHRENVPSRAYVEFATPEAVITFNRDYNGHVFRDKQGNESVAVVEYALYQKVPHEKRKADAKVGTIESDEDFISFLEALNKPMEPTPDINELVAQAATTTEPSSTPLLDALKAAKEASTIKGYHSHYREQSSQPRKQDLEDDDAFNRNAPLLLKNQQDSAASGGPEPPIREVERGKEKEKEGDRKERDEIGSGGKKGKNRSKPVNGPKSPKPVPSAPQPPTSSAPTRPTTESLRPRPTARMNAHVLAALGATTLARGGRKGGRQREISGGTPNADTSAQSTTVPTPAPVTSTPAPITAPPPPLPAGVIAISPPLKPPKSGRGKGRSRGGPSNETGGGPAPTTPSNPADMPRIDDPNQALPPVIPAQRGRGGNPGRGRGGRGRGRGRGRGGGGGARAADDQPSTSTG